MLKIREICQDDLPRHALFVLLGLSFALRVVLVLRGGQLYFPDEEFYLGSLQQFVSLFVRGDVGGALDLLVGIAHPGFLLLGSIPETIQYSLDSLLGLSPNSTTWIPVLILSLMSVASIGLTAAIARRAGAGEREGFIAAVLMASATSMLYYSRHLVPYDLSLTLGLLALWTALDARSSSARSVGCGLLAGLAFFTYYGYWPLAVTVGAVHTLRRNPKAADLVKRAVAFGCGFVLLPTLLTFASILRDATPFVLAMAKFAGTVNQGSFAEGWRLPWAYLWEAEHGLWLIWAVGALTTLGLPVRRRGVAPTRGHLWLGVAYGIYLVLAIGSTGLEKFVIYGRLVRQLVPFFCLATAFSLSFFAEHWEIKRHWAWLGVIVLAAQVAFNFRQPLLQQFPLDVERTVIATYGQVGRALTVIGPRLVGNECCLIPRYELINAQYLYPISAPERKIPAGRTILQTDHPLQFSPYQYEGYDPNERSILQSVDLSMRLIDTQITK